MSLSYYYPRRSLFDDEWSIFDPLFKTLDYNSTSGRARAERDVNTLAPLLTADVIEEENNFAIHCDLPGVEANDLELTVEGKNLVIKAEKKHVHKTGTDKVHSMERTYGKAQRSIRLPANVDLDNVQSKFKNGVLSITVPKKALPPAETKKIAINSA